MNFVPLIVGSIVAASPPASTSSTAPHFEIDPIADGAVLGLALSVGMVSQALTGTGELRPQAPGDPSVLLGIDRSVATSDHITPGSKTAANALLASAFAYAVLDTALAGALDRGPDGALTYGILYLESAALNLALGNMVKLAVRRPRPSSYHAALAGRPSQETNASVSFYSGHTAFTAGLGATATYLAFERGGDVEPWIVLGASTAMTIGVGASRVLSRSHFPTDVIAGAFVGAGLGVLVPHLHRTRNLEMRLGPGPGEAGLALTGRF